MSFLWRKSYSLVFIILHYFYKYPTDIVASVKFTDFVIDVMVELRVNYDLY